MRRRQCRVSNQEAANQGGLSWLGSSNRRVDFVDGDEPLDR